MGDWLRFADEDTACKGLVALVSTGRGAGLATWAPLPSAGHPSGDVLVTPTRQTRPMCSLPVPLCTNWTQNEAVERVVISPQRLPMTVGLVPCSRTSA